MTSYSGGQIHTQRAFFPPWNYDKDLLHYILDSGDSRITDRIFRDTAHHYKYDAHCDWLWP